MPSESTLSIEEKNSLKIERFIFHIILRNQEEPVFLDEVILEENEKEFFQDRIITSAEGTQFIFVDNEEDSQSVKDLSRELIDNDDEFVHISKQLAGNFRRYHKTVNTPNGVFIVSIVSILKNGNKIKLLSMINMDHTRVVQFQMETNQAGSKIATLQEIMNTFVEDKKAIQKMALIDPTGNFLWDVLGSQRTSKDGLADYFKDFLGVNIREVPSYWTRTAVTVVRRWAKSLDSSSVPENENPATYTSRAIQYMESSDSFDTDVFLDTVVKDLEDNQRKTNMMCSLREYLAEKGVAGQTFVPMPESITSATKKMTIRTSNEVQVIWNGDPSDRGIKIPTKRNRNGKYCLTIETDNLPEIK